MKKAIQALLLGFLLVLVNLTNPALSQEQQNNVSRLPIMVDCGAKEVMLDSIVNQWKEIPFAEMLVKFTAPNGQLLSGMGTMWVNAKTGTWSYIVSFPNSDQVCYFLGGEKFGPAVTGSPS